MAPTPVLNSTVSPNTTLLILWSMIENAVDNIDLSELYTFVIDEFQQVDTQRTIAIVTIMYIASLFLRAVLRLLKYIFCCGCCKNDKKKN